LILRRLYIRDFGMIRNQTMNNIGSGMVIIGGRNRAGKTTLFQILRFLGYGFPRGINLPPASNQYGVEGDLLLDNGETLNINLEGYREPELNSTNYSSAKEIYGGLDSFTYQRLFTIDLDELQRIPSGVNSDKTEKLQSILLGAGLSDILRLPRLEEAFRKRAEKIGGIRGDPAVKDFKPYYQEIDAGLKLRTQALNQVTEFREKRAKLNQTIKEINDCQSMSNGLDQEIILLDLLKNNYQDLEKIKKYAEEYRDLLKKQQENSKKPEEWQEYLIKYKHKLRYYQQQASGLQERIKNYHQLKIEKNREKSRLLNEIANLNQDLDSFNQLLELKTDTIERDLLRNKLEKYTDLQQEIKTQKNIINELTEKEKELTEMIDTLKTEEPTAVLRKYFMLAIAITTSGLLLSTVNLWSGIIVVFGGITGLAIYLIVNYIFNNSLIIKKRELKLQLKQIKTDLERQNIELKILIESFDQLRDKLQEYRRMLRLVQDFPLKYLPDYLRDIQILKKDIIEWQKKEELYQQNHTNLTDELNKLSNVLSGFPGIILFEEWSPLEYSGQLFQHLQEINRYLDLKQQIIQSLKTDRVKGALERLSCKDIKDEPELFENFTAFYKDYTSIDHVEKTYQEYLTTQKKLQEKIEGLKEERQRLADNLEELATTDKLQEAQRRIDIGRAGLSQLAEEYASYQTAVFILRKVRLNFMDQSKDTLLLKAGEILQKITGDEYQKILPADNLTEPDLQAVLKDGRIQDNTSFLSRATGEQLFFAVRLSRIYEIKPPLPVIIDDSLVNFDNFHLTQTLEILYKLAETNQVFILTCHPSLLETINDYGKDIQYWQLEKGVLKIANSESLLSHLSVL
jgi:uncharacterized protein YhaN